VAVAVHQVLSESLNGNPPAATFSRFHVLSSALITGGLFLLAAAVIASSLHLTVQIIHACGPHSSFSFTQHSLAINVHAGI